MRVVFKTSYDHDIRLWKHEGSLFWYAVLLAALFAMPLVADTFFLGELSMVMIWTIAGVGLMLLTGYTGQVSLGHAAFMGIGAYAEGWLINHGVPFVIALPLSGLLAAAVGMVIAVPASRMTGIYLAIATLAFAMIVEQTLVHWETVTGGFHGLAVPPADLFGFVLDGPESFYYLCLAVCLVVILAALNILRSPTGRAFVAVRDSQISAQSMGIDTARIKIAAFGLSAGITGLAGALFGHRLGMLSPDAFNLILSVQLLLMVVVGGLGSLHGAVYGAVFVGLLPQALAILRDELPTKLAQMPGLEPGVFGLILVLFIVFEPMGLYGRWLKVKTYFDIFPLYRRATFKRQKAYLKTERMK